MPALLYALLLVLFVAAIPVVFTIIALLGAIALVVGLVWSIPGAILRRLK